jgi:hypothetical protein
VRIGAAVAALSWLLALAPCGQPSQCAPTKAARTCCAAVEHCRCCGQRQPPLHEPGPGSSKAAPEHAGDLAVAQAPTDAPACGAADPAPLRLLPVETAVPAYLSTCTFRC